MQSPKAGQTGLVFFRLPNVNIIGLHQKMARRGIDIAALSEGNIETTIYKSSLTVPMQQGIDQKAGQGYQDIQTQGPEQHPG